MTIEVIPLSSALGADIRGVDVGKPLDADTLAAIKQAWADHLVLRFRGQRLSEDQLVAFSRNFGELDQSPPNEAALASKGYVPTHPEIAVISNVVVDGVAIGSLGAYEADWHTDMSYNPEPPSASLLYALEVPPSGGDTSFCNMYLAYQALSPALRAIADTRRATHDATYTSTGALRKGAREVSDVSQAAGARHPMARTHPVTGRPALFLGRRQNGYIAGLPVPESERLLDAIWASATRPEFTWTQSWRQGDLLIWDNRCAMHRRDAFDPSTRRLMHRTQVKGDTPFFRPAR